MQLVRLQMIGIVARNGISALNGDIMAQKGIFGIMGNDHILVYHPIISYKRIKVYRAETMDMGRFHWNNGVSGK